MEEGMKGKRDQMSVWARESRTVMERKRAEWYGQGDVLATCLGTDIPASHV